MQFEEFKAFMLQSAAQHDRRIAQIEESLGRITNTLERLVDYRVELQEDFDHRWREAREDFDHRWREMQEGFDQRWRAIQGGIEATQRQIDSLSRVVMHHVTDPTAHQR